MPSPFVYFDLGNVLLQFSHERGYRQIAEAAAIPENRVRSILVDSGLNDRYESGQLTTDEFHHEFCQLAEISLGLAPFRRAWGDIFEIIPSTIRVAANLAQAGYRLGILSNTGEIHWSWSVARFRILSQLFCPVITSYEAGAMKPRSEIYEIAASRAGVTAGEIVFMDDRLENVEGARRAGWRAIHFGNAVQASSELDAMGLRFNR